MKLITLVIIALTSILNAQGLTNKVVTLPKEVHQKIKWLNDNFLLFTPKGNSEANKSPLIIFLHGMGERGKNNINAVKRQCC
mgnify:CR=1 FL=1